MKSYYRVVLGKKSAHALDFFAGGFIIALEDSANLPAPGVIATEIVEDLRAALEQFAEIEADLKE